MPINFETVHTIFTIRLLLSKVSFDNLVAIGMSHQLSLTSTMTSFTSEYSVFNETTIETNRNVRELAMSYLLYQIGKLDINS